MQWWHVGVLWACVCTVGVQGLTEEIEITPSNTNGFEIGELSTLQFVVMMLIFLKLVTLYAIGVLPFEVDLGGGLPPALSNRRKGVKPRPQDSHYHSLYHQEQSSYSTTNRAMSWSSSYFLDCPLQFVCDVDFWANQEHDGFMESLIAGWFKNPNHTWTHPDATAFGGRGTCREMYPCPFDVQEAIGITIPGTQNLQSLDSEDLDLSSFF
ncbi:unnamed protein product [Meganyctiphanes norvegica]|uniref:Uncharacterized protein n=1 Tax=Meganyctiphanes norvegica TaxID=48144 RepID=A0AAV2PQH6_MEGNR